VGVCRWAVLDDDLRTIAAGGRNLWLVGGGDLVGR
jgi:hypothetical protein